MKLLVFPLSFAMLLTGCYGSFSYEGQLTSSSGEKLTGCTDQLEDLNGRVLIRARPIELLSTDAPNLRDYMTVAPYAEDYILVIACQSHMPFRARVRHGSEELRSKALQLGDVVLKYTGRT